jgi:hypothetical protein
MHEYLPSVDHLLAYKYVCEKLMYAYFSPLLISSSHTICMRAANPLWKVIKLQASSCFVTWESHKLLFSSKGSSTLQEYYKSTPTQDWSQSSTEKKYARICGHGVKFWFSYNVTLQSFSCLISWWMKFLLSHNFRVFRLNRIRWAAWRIQRP